MSSATHPSTDVPRPAGAFEVERNGLNVVAEAERRGRARDLFWPWCAANISVLGLSYAAFVLYFGLSFWQALLASVIGTVASFVLVGLVSLAGRRGSAPTMALSRAAFGVRGNALPGLVSYVTLVGWETVLVALSTLATATIFGQLGWSSGNLTKIIAFAVVVALIVAAGVIGFELIMRLQKWLTVATVVLTVGYIALTAGRIDLAAVAAMPAGPTTAVFGAFVLMATAFGLSWVNSAADYSRYLPRSARGSAVVWWTTFGGAVAPVVLLTYGFLLIGSQPALLDGIAADPLGTLGSILPTWFLLPYAVVVVGGLVAGAVLDIYSSGLTLLSLGVPIPRWAAALLDGVLMIIGAVYVVWFATDFIGPFQGFLITLGVPLASWCGIFLADLASRRRDYDEAALFDPAGRYRSLNPVPVVLLIVSAALGWGLVTNSAAGFAWQGYLLGPLGFGGRDGAWAFANLGVALAFVLSFVGYRVLCARRVGRQEAVATAAAT